MFGKYPIFCSCFMRCFDNLNGVVGFSPWVEMFSFNLGSAAFCSKLWNVQRYHPQWFMKPSPAMWLFISLLLNSGTRIHPRSNFTIWGAVTSLPFGKCHQLKISDRIWDRSNSAPLGKGSEFQLNTPIAKKSNSNWIISPYVSGWTWTMWTTPG